MKIIIFYIVLTMAFSFAPTTIASAQSDQGAVFSDTGDSQPEGRLINTYEYYDNGKIMLCSKQTPAGQIVEKDYYNTDGKIEKIERYDEAGEKIEEANYNEEGKLTVSISGWAAKRWVYKDGTLRIESAYGPDGHLTERMFYNETGDLVDRQYVGDGKIDPYEEFNRGVVVTHETDQFFTASGNETGSITTEVDDPDDMDPLDSQ